MGWGGTYDAREREVQGVPQGKAHTEMLDVREVPRDVAQERGRHRDAAEVEHAERGARVCQAGEVRARDAPVTVVPTTSAACAAGIE